MQGEGFLQMLTTQRKKLILARIAANGQVVAKELAIELGTSEDTIRRDLRELARGGKLQRVHGGALPASAAVGDLQAREQVSPQGQDRTGPRRRGDDPTAAGGDSGRRHRPRSRWRGNFRLICAPPSSPTVRRWPWKRPSIPHVEIIMLGGRLFRHSMVNVGRRSLMPPHACEPTFISRAVTGVHPEAGLSTGDAEEAAVKRGADSNRAADTIDAGIGRETHGGLTVLGDVVHGNQPAGGSIQDA